MSNDDSDNLVAAQRRSDAARQRLAGTLVDIQARLNPKALAREAAQELREAGAELMHEGLEAAKKHSLSLAGVVAAIGVFLARKPLRHLLGTEEPGETPPPLPRLPAKSRKGTSK